MTVPIRRELGIFLIVGLITVGIDFLIYRGFMFLKPLGLESINIAKGIGFISGTVFAYFANRIWTFKQQITASGSLYRFTVVYIFGLISNIVVNYLSIDGLAALRLRLMSRYSSLLF